MSDFSIVLNPPPVFEVNLGISVPTPAWNSLTGTANHIPLDTSPTEVPTTEGTLAWDEAEGCPSYAVPGGSSEINKEIWDYYTNLSGATLVDGDIVSVIGVSGNRTAVSLTDPNSEASAKACIGMVTYGAAQNQKVRVTKIGTVKDVNTNGWTEGSRLYVSASNPGKITNVAPSYPSATISVGIIKTASNSVGVVDVDVDVDLRTIAGATVAPFTLAEVVWDDMTFPSNGINPPGTADAPTRSNTTGMLEFSGTLDNIIAGQVQFSHRRKNGTPVKPHLHVICPTASATAVSRWKLEINRGGGGLDFENNYGTWTTVGTISIANPNNVKQPVMMGWGEIDMTGRNESALIMWRITRLAGTDAADTDAMVVLQDVDFHYQIDKLGSEDEY